MDTSPGAKLAKLLLDTFTAMVGDVVAQLEREGHPGVTATHAFALEAIDDGAQSASALGRSLGVSRQAAAKTIAALEELHYVNRHDDPADARRKRLAVTPRGLEMIAIGARTFDTLRSQAGGRVGLRKLEIVEEVLVILGSRSSSSPSAHTREEIQ
ncbi:MarR family winged helix-turn-helix transcriptional regulator [Pengzhenrongella sicca]|uniref:Winged helix DNA-binding protein n=1 Tax=Pengzhenrongella sicca TaxID=2819238 RepID=A0A8A4ZBV7_9MICO|nr:winged helix DNA-binding protein [Pengzhenrongella sicca]QTE29364.1 winged helix DNA-binding protein [Pengzhenrongella sicca]